MKISLKSCNEASSESMAANEPAANNAGRDHDSEEVPWEQKDAKDSVSECEIWSQNVYLRLLNNNSHRRVEWTT